MIIGIIWVISAIYCLVRLYKGYGNRSLDGVIGVTPGFDTIVFVIGAPFFASVDLAIRWYKKVWKN